MSHMRSVLFRQWRLLLLLSVGVLLLVLTLRAVTVSQLFDALRELQLWEVLLLALVNGLIIISFTGRWWLFLLGQGYRIPLLRLTGYRMAAFGVSYFTPGPHFGGEPLQVYLVTRRHGVPTAVSIAAVTMDKLFELAANFTFLVLGLIFGLQRRVVPGAVGDQAIAYAVLLLLAPLAVLGALWLGKHPLSAVLSLLLRLWPNPLLKRWHAVLYQSELLVTDLCRQRPRLLFAALGVSSLSWVLVIGEYWLTTRFLGLDLTFAQAILALIATRIAILLPVPAGLGTLEASQVIAMNLLGKNPATGAAIALLIRARDVLVGLLGLWIGGAGIWSLAAQPIGEVSHAPMSADDRPAPAAPAVH